MALATDWQAMVADAMVSTKNYHKCKLIIILAVDIDECRENTDGCVQICSNTIGSYACSCNSGYRLATDRHACNGTLSNGIHILLIDAWVFLMCRN